MNTRSYEYFEQTYRLRSFAKAARAIPISPQGLTKAIRSLESELGVSLFDDSERIQTPTPYGELFHQYACRVLDAQQELDAAIREEKRRCSTTVIPVCSSTGILGAMGEVITDFETEHPETAIMLEDYPDYMCESHLKTGECSLALTLYPYDSDFITIELYADTHYLWVNRDDALSEKHEATLTDLQGRALISVGPEFKWHDELDRMCREADVHCATHKTSSEMSLIQHRVHDGRGVGLTVRHQAKLFAFDECVVALPFPDLPWRFGLSYLKTHVLTSQERQFIDYLIMYARRMKERNALVPTEMKEKGQPPCLSA